MASKRKGKPKDGAKQKSPVFGADPTNHKEVRLGADPASYDTKKIAWQIRLFDEEGPWGLEALKPHWWTKIFPKLRNLESMTWAEIKRASGGRTRGNNSHNVAVSDLITKAQDRLCELGQEDVDELFSLRLQGKHRIYGIKDGRVLKAIWFDPDHEIYPSGKG